MAEWLGSALQKLLQQFESVWYLFIPLCGIFFYMLTPEEISFMEYWAQKRTHKKTSLRQFAIGLPFGVLLVLALFINVLTGWHKTAAMAMQNNGSLIMVILIAGIAIVIFMTLFSQRYQWEQKEQRYQELLQKQKQSNDAAI